MSSPKKPRGPANLDDIGTRVWKRLSDHNLGDRASTDAMEVDTGVVQRLSTRDIEKVEEDDPIGDLRALIKAVRKAPRDAEAAAAVARPRGGTRVVEQLAVLLADEAHVQAPCRA